MDGGWSDFGDWGDCSRPCGGGKQERMRTCTNPRPVYGGADCSGSDRQTRRCNEDPCSGRITSIELYYTLINRVEGPYRYISCPKSLYALSIRLPSFNPIQSNDRVENNELYQRKVAVDVLIAVKN